MVEFFRRIFEAIFGVFKKKTELSLPEKPLPVGPIVLPWDGKHSDASAWTEHLQKEVAESTLPDLSAAGIEDFCPNFSKLSRELKVIFYMNLISVMAKFESGFKPETQYVEKDIKDASGSSVISRGLLQLSFESANSYGCALPGPTLLHDPLVNLSCAIKIMEGNIKKHGVFSGQNEAGKWLGASAYWSVMRKLKGGVERPSYASIRSHVLGLKLGGDIKPDIKVVPPISGTPWMDWMHSHLGEKEVSGKADNAFIMSLYKYGNYPTEHDEVPWCAVTVCAALELNGYKDSNRADAKSYDNYGTACELKYGAIVTLRHPSGGRHVGFCEDPGDTKTFKMLGGNQSNALNVKTWNRSEIVAVRWPVKL